MRLLILNNMASKLNMNLNPLPSYWNQYVAGISAIIGAMAMGTVLGFASPAGLQLTSNSTTLHLQENQIAWFSSIVPIGAVFGGPLAGYLMDKIGRKGTMLTSIIPYMLGWGLIGFAQYFEMLMVGQFFLGMCCGIMSLVVPTYIGEIASPEIRGRLGSGFQLMVTIGILFSYLVGSYTTWQYLALANAIIPCVFFVLMFFSKESPKHLLSKGRDTEAEETLKYFRGPDYYIQIELDQMTISIGEAQRNKAGFSDLIKPHIYRPLVISLGLMFFQQFCGINAVLFNLGTIFESTGSGMSAELCSITIAVVQVVATFTASLFMDKLGRRTLLLGSSIFMSLSLAALGFYFFFMKFSWLPLVALILFIVAFSLGFGPIPWLMMGELFSEDVKLLAGSIATAVNWTLSFLVACSFNPLQNKIHNYGVYWLFSGICGASFIFCLTIVKETKGKSLEEIADMFGKPSQELPQGKTPKHMIGFA